MKVHVSVASVHCTGMPSATEPTIAVALSPAGSLSSIVTGSFEPSIGASPRLLKTTLTSPSPPGGRFVGTVSEPSCHQGACAEGGNRSESAEHESGYEGRQEHSEHALAAR